MNAIPSQLTAAGLSTLVVLFIGMASSLGWVTLDPDQLVAVGAFIVAASNFGFGFLLWYVNRGTPNPSA